MDFRQLETFVAVAKFKSFSKAAENLYLTQPTVSSHIINLEKELNTILVNRSNKNISLTKAGEILYDYAMNIMNLKESALFRLNEYRGRMVGNIEIASSTIPEQYIVPELICEFNKVFPEVTFSVFHYDSQEVLEGITQGSIDFGIVGAKIPSNQLTYYDLVSDELFLITPVRPPYDKIEQIELKEILQEPFIFREEGSGTRHLVEKILQDNNIPIDRLNTIAHIENTEAIKQCIRRGLGISFLSKRAVEDEIKLKLLKAIQIKDISLTRRFYFVYHKHRTPSPLEKAFQNFVCNYYEDNGSQNT